MGRRIPLGLTLLLAGLLTLPAQAQALSPAQQLWTEYKYSAGNAIEQPHSAILTPPDPEQPAQDPEPAIDQPVELILNLSERQLYVYRGNAVEATYPVAIGRAGWETPTGSFTVSYMLENPGWTNPFTGEALPPGPNNPLGERWIAFWTDGQNEIGFHGTPNRDSVGQAASHGCVRMYNEHIRELYEQVQPGTLVTVLP